MCDAKYNNHKVASNFFIDLGEASGRGTYLVPFISSLKVVLLAKSEHTERTSYNNFLLHIYIFLARLCLHKKKPRVSCDLVPDTLNSPLPGKSSKKVQSEKKKKMLPYDNKRWCGGVRYKVLVLHSRPVTTK